MPLPPDVLELHTVLHNFLCRAWSHFAAFEYVASLQLPDRALLNRAAPGLYWLLLDTLGDQVVLETARMLDRPTTSGQQNASLDRLEAAIRPHVPSHLLESFGA